MAQIEIYAAKPDQIDALAKLDRSYQTTRVWQLERGKKEGEEITSFREIRLPRPASIEYPYLGELLRTRILTYDAILVANLDGVISGYVTLKKMPSSGMVWISELVVDNLLRNKNVGTALLLAAQEWSIQYNFGKVCLEIQSKNHPGICIAKKLGFEFAGYHDWYYPNQDIALFFVIKV